jgi:hypothetical protein
VRALLDAWDVAERAVVQPDRREDVLALLAAQPDTDRVTAEQMYDTLLDPVHGLCVGGEIEPAALESVLRLRAEAGGFDQQHDLAALARPGSPLLRPLRE